MPEALIILQSSLSADERAAIARVAPVKQAISDRVFVADAGKVHGPNATKFANSFGHGVRNHVKRPATGQKRLGRLGSVCNGRRRGRDEN